MVVGAGSWLEEAERGLLLMADLFGWNLLAPLLAALPDLVYLLALDLGPRPEHHDTLPPEQAEPPGEECCGCCCSSCSCCCQGLRHWFS